MGFYINPKVGTKEEYVKKHRIAQPFQGWEGRPKGSLPVCIVNNGPFTAAGVCFDELEYAAFNSPDDYRPKSWYYLPVQRCKEGGARMPDRILPEDCQGL